MAGGHTKHGTVSDVLVYNGNEDKWTKVGDLCYARSGHTMSLVTEDVVDQCIFDLDCNF